MATERYYLCPKCGDKSRAATLFDSLRAMADGKLPRCPNRCAASPTLHLSFPWGLGAEAFPCLVLDAFLPDKDKLETWHDKGGHKVTFCPFLVILQGTSRSEKKYAWLPYWHVVRNARRKQKTKYGQWAPNMNLATFDELIAKARSKGYLKLQVR